MYVNYHFLVLLFNYLTVTSSHTTLPTSCYHFNYGNNYGKNTVFCVIYKFDGKTLAAANACRACLKVGEEMRVVSGLYHA